MIALLLEESRQLVEDVVRDVEVRGDFLDEGRAVDADELAAEARCLALSRF